MAMRTVATELVGALRMRCSLPSRMVLALRPFSSFCPDGTKFLKSHEWVLAKGDTGTIGISDFAQRELGDIVFVELPEVGAHVTKGETFGVVESVKAASDVYSPVTGEVVEKNEALSDNPSLVNDAAFTDGWIMKVKLDDPKEMDDLLDGAAYKKRCDDAEH